MKGQTEKQPGHGLLVRINILTLLVITAIFWVTTIPFGPFDQLYLRHFGMSLITDK